MTSSDIIAVSWCEDPAHAAELGAFFARNISPEYISHSELQGPRAIDVARWRPGIETILISEIETRVARGRGVVAAEGDSYPILEARRDGRLVAVAFVSLVRSAPVPYAILEDVAVDRELRGQGVGSQTIEWVVARARQHGCKRIFLESGVTNHHAHELFERHGFKTCSIVMMKPLAEPS